MYREQGHNSSAGQQRNEYRNIPVATALRLTDDSVTDPGFMQHQAYYTQNPNLDKGPAYDGNGGATGYYQMNNYISPNRARSSTVPNGNQYEIPNAQTYYQQGSAGRTGPYGDLQLGSALSPTSGRGVNTHPSNFPPTQDFQRHTVYPEDHRLQNFHSPPRLASGHTEQMYPYQTHSSHQKQPIEQKQFKTAYTPSNQYQLPGKAEQGGQVYQMVDKNNLHVRSQQTLVKLRETNGGFSEQGRNTYIPTSGRDTPNVQQAQPRMSTLAGQTTPNQQAKTQGVPTNPQNVQTTMTTEQTAAGTRVIRHYATQPMPGVSPSQPQIVLTKNYPTTSDPTMTVKLQQPTPQVNSALQQRLTQPMQAGPQTQGTPLNKQEPTTTTTIFRQNPATTNTITQDPATTTKTTVIRQDPATTTTTIIRQDPKLATNIMRQEPAITTTVIKQEPPKTTSAIGHPQTAATTTTTMSPGLRQDIGNTVTKQEPPAGNQIQDQQRGTTTKIIYRKVEQPGDQNAGMIVPANNVNGAPTASNQDPQKDVTTKVIYRKIEQNGDQNSGMKPTVNPVNAGQTTTIQTVNAPRKSSAPIQGTTVYTYEGGQLVPKVNGTPGLDAKTVYTYEGGQLIPKVNGTPGLEAKTVYTYEGGQLVPKVNGTPGLEAKDGVVQPISGKKELNQATIASNQGKQVYYVKAGEKVNPFSVPTGMTITTAAQPITKDAPVGSLPTPFQVVQQGLLTQNKPPPLQGHVVEIKNLSIGSASSPNEDKTGELRKQSAPVVQDTDFAGNKIVKSPTENPPEKLQSPQVIKTIAQNIQPKIDQTKPESFLKAEVSNIQTQTSIEAVGIYNPFSAVASNNETKTSNRQIQSNLSQKKPEATKQIAQSSQLASPANVPNSMNDSRVSRYDEVINRVLNRTMDILKVNEKYEVMKSTDSFMSRKSPVMSPASENTQRKADQSPLLGIYQRYEHISDKGRLSLANDQVLRPSQERNQERRSECSNREGSPSRWNDNKLVSPPQSYSTKPDNGSYSKNENFIPQSYSNRSSKERKKEYLPDGSLYEGEILRGLFHGKGRLTLPTGDYFEGEWTMGERNGYGVLYDASGFKRYEGEWAKNLPNGEGILFNDNKVPRESLYGVDFNNFNNLGDAWDKYEGEFVDGEQSGMGTLYLATGEKFMGSFSNGRIHGQGTFTRADGKIIVGEWRNNILTFEF